MIHHSSLRTYTQLEKMKLTTTIILLIQCIIGYSQEIIEEKNDTIFCIKQHHLINQNIGEIIYFKTLKSQLGLSKEALFIRGMSPYLQLDSIKYYNYDSNWQLYGTETLKGKEINLRNPNINTNPYTKEEFIIQKSIYQVKITPNSPNLINVEVKNNLPQDYFIEQIPNEHNGKFQAEKHLILSRKTKLIPLNIKVEKGASRHVFKLKNSNGFVAELEIDVIGYDMLKEDFVNKSEAESARGIIRKWKEDIYIEVEGNNKLLKVIKDDEELVIPVSKVVNRIKGTTLKEGEYSFELSNLKTSKKKYCKVIIER